MRKKPDGTKREKIIEMFKAGKQPIEIAEELQTGKSYVYTTLAEEKLWNKRPYKTSKAKPTTYSAVPIQPTKPKEKSDKITLVIGNRSEIAALLKDL